ncbi:LacI family DNA-binding transcriptional regulator [Phytomonospora sp. NPDC050363]|uniref:LacI family DNA-binding transcriptional regulator n=1 Tax=Phytomonospora sp. NPDC050363 TaxID=3155642 RepID=UPI0033E530FB
MSTQRQARLADVAALAGVSPATASRVLNGSPHRVTKTLHERVLAAARELRYTPNAQAQALARKTSGTIALLLHDVADPYFAAIAGGVLSAADARGVRVLIADTGSDPRAKAGHLAALRTHRPRAAILVGSRTTDAEAEAELAAELDELRAGGANVVSVGQPGLPGAVVRPDNHAGARRLAEYLTAAGHRTFGVVAGPPTLLTVGERLAGFTEGLAAAGITLDQGAVRHADFSRDGGYEAGRDFDTAATAVFVTGDVMATGFCTALRERGIAVPGDVSVAGFDDVPVVADLSPALTTVRLPLSDMGSRALSLALDGPADTVVEAVAELVVRDSVVELNGG